MRVSYSWSNQPSGMKSKVPSDEYYHSGDNVMIDTTYNNKSGYKSESWSVSEATVPSNQKWTFVCYGNGKFVAFGHDTVIGLITPSTTYYQFSGWNKSDFNITTDTSITASWNTVSSGDGLNFID